MTMNCTTAASERGDPRSIVGRDSCPTRFGATLAAVILIFSSCASTSNAVQASTSAADFSLVTVKRTPTPQRRNET